MQVDIERVGTDRFVGNLSPTASDVNYIAHVAPHDERVGFAGKIQHFALVERECVVAAACKIDRLDPQQAIVAEGGQVFFLLLNRCTKSEMFCPSLIMLAL